MIKPDTELNDIIRRFTRDDVEGCRLIETGKAENDFRLVVIVYLSSGEKLVVKLADNDFTDSGRIAVWQRTVREYRRLGYYLPEIYTDLDGSFPKADYCGRSCIIYAEEYSRYSPAEDRFSGEKKQSVSDWDHMRDAWIMTARIASQHFDYCDFPSAYCMFETFCPSDKTDEVMESALEWKKAADRLPAQFAEKTARLWEMWLDNRRKLEKIYHLLPRSVFQGDLNDSNILLDEKGRFAGVCDMNLCGREVVLKYVLGENNGAEPERIFRVLDTFSEYYDFSEEEKEAAILIYRCITPFWWAPGKELREAQNDAEKASALLDRAERILTEDIGLRGHMIKRTEGKA